MDDYVPPFTIGHHDRKRPLPVTTQTLAEAHAAGYDIVTSVITTPYFHSRVLSLLSGFLSESSTRGLSEITSSHNASPVHIPSLAPEDTPLTPDESISQTIAITSSWIDLCSPDPVIADISRQVLRLELQYAAFCGISYVLIPGPRSRTSGCCNGRIAQFARAILDALNTGPYMQFFIWLPMIDQHETIQEGMGDLGPFARAQYLESEDDHKRVDLFGTWEAWNSIRSLCRYSSRLSIALSLPRLVPPSSIQSRWYSEPVRFITLDASIFTKNTKGYPVLSKFHQTMVGRFAHLKQPSCWFLLCNVGAIPTKHDQDFSPNKNTTFPTPAESSLIPHLTDPTPHLSYMRNLQSRQPSRSVADRFGAGYQDYLQAPLQPLTVNLESITYEVFEKDPIKYDWYERAIARALHDWIEQGKPSSNPDGRVVVAVVGAGRGPLVTRALQASEAVGVEIDMWALEKNPNAFVLLQRHNQNMWNDKVNLVKSDMRTWRGPTRNANAAISRLYNKDPSTPSNEQTDRHVESMVDVSPKEPVATRNSGSPAPTVAGTANYKIDILISELLGSFGDNELSPECLDGVQHLLNPIHGISIPASYTAHVTPIAAPKLHADISLTMTNSVSNAAEIPYVVMFNAMDFLSTAKSSSAKPASGIGGSEKASPSEPNLTRQTYSAVARQQKGVGANSETASSEKTPDSIPIIQQTWAFHHPNPAVPTLPGISSAATAAPSNAHNSRYCSLNFPVPNRGTCHGLGGYFETVLYPGVELSTNPLTMEAKSADMISWFPIYFPLKSPLYLPDGSSLTVQMWRQSDERKIWYEWLVDVYGIITESHVDTKTGKAVKREKRVRIGGSEMHSSEKEGCLM